MAGSRCAPLPPFYPFEGLRVHQRTMARTVRSALHFCEGQQRPERTSQASPGFCTTYDHKGLSGPCPVDPPRLTYQFPWQVRCLWSTPRGPEEWVLSLGFSRSIYCRSLLHLFLTAKSAVSCVLEQMESWAQARAVSWVQLLLKQPTSGTTGVLDTLAVHTANRAGRGWPKASQLNKGEVNGLLKPPIGHSEY